MLSEINGRNGENIYMNDQRQCMRNHNDVGEFKVHGFVKDV